MKLGIGISFVTASCLSVWADSAGFKIPTISWGYNFSRSAGELKLPSQILEDLVSGAGVITAVILFLVGLFLIVSKMTSGPPNPVTLRKIQRFKAIKRGYYSFLILIGLAGLASLDQLIVGKEALAVGKE